MQFGRMIRGCWRDYYVSKAVCNMSERPYGDYILRRGEEEEGRSISKGIDEYCG